MSPNSIKGIFEAFEKLNVLIIGDVMVDTYSYGHVGRISPEAPVPVLRVDRDEKRLGGAANVALNIQAMGANPILCSVIGDDRYGEHFTSLMKEKGLESRGIIKSSNRMTTKKHRVISGAQHMLRIDTEDDSPLQELDKKTLINHIEMMMSSVDLIIFEDYDKGVLDPEVIELTIAKAKQVNLPTAVDPKNRNFFHFSGCNLFKPNIAELSGGLGLSINPTIDSLENAVEKLIQKMPVDNVLVTLGHDGIFYRNDGGSDFLKAHTRVISDISGAGDTVISIAALSFALGLSLPFAAEFANLGGGIVCEYQGVVPVNPTRLFEEAERSLILKDLLVP